MSPRLLVVEDDASLRGVLARGLREEGFEVTTMATGGELLERAVRDQPDVMIIDIGLPDSDGRDLCQALRTRGVESPVLFLTPTEFRLLAALASRRGRALRRLELVRTAWPHGAIVHDNTLDVYIARLRRKLGRLDGAPGIVTVHGVGYSLR
jgi:DNA-binding response OmpR family regulator